MNNLMKKLTCFTMVVIMALCFAACTDSIVESIDNDPAPVVNDPQLEAVVELYRDDFINGFESSFSSSSGGMQSKCELAVSGTTLIVSCFIGGVDNVPQESKKQMQDIYDSQKDVLKTSFQGIKDQAPTLSHVTMNVCEEDGDVIAKVEIDF